MNNQSKESIPKFNKYSSHEMSHGNSPWLTIKEACEYIKCGKTKIMELVHSGLIPYQRLDHNKKSSIRILKYDLNKYLLFPHKVRLNAHEKELLNEISK